jgi:hypothetical protein
MLREGGLSQHIPNSLCFFVSKRAAQHVLHTYGKPWLHVKDGGLCGGGRRLSPHSLHNGDQTQIHMVLKQHLVWLHSTPFSDFNWEAVFLLLGVVFFFSESWGLNCLLNSWEDGIVYVFCSVFTKESKLSKNLKKPLCFYNISLF